MKIIIPALLFAGCVFVSVPEKHSQRVNLEKHGIKPSHSSVMSEKYLAEMVIPRVNFEVASLPRVVSILNEISTELPDDHPKIILLNEDEVKEVTVSFLKHDASVLTIIDTICRSADLKWWIDGDVYITSTKNLASVLSNRYSPEGRTRQVRQ